MERPKRNESGIHKRFSSNLVFVTNRKIMRNEGEFRVGFTTNLIFRANRKLVRSEEVIQGTLHNQLVVFTEKKFQIKKLFKLAYNLQPSF